MKEDLKADSKKQKWHGLLTDIQAKPLQQCPKFPEIARRWNAWWRFEADRPLVIGQITDKSDIRWDKAFDLLDQPEAWLEVRRKQVEHTIFIGETLPSIRVDIGPVSIAAFLGAPLHFAHAEQTSWQDPIIRSWEEALPLRVDPDNPWLRQVMMILEQLSDDAQGKYVVCLPDLTGAVDVLANLRSTEKLCFDLIESREYVKTAADNAADAWKTVFDRMYNVVLSQGAGITQWISCWADTPFTVPTCDFNALIGPKDFREVCMPPIKKQARHAGLCVFHLDGPDAARHADTLAEDPDITAVQYTPGAGAPSALAMLPMFKNFQKYKKPLFIDCPLSEFKPLTQALEPSGLAVRISEFNTVETAEALIKWRDAEFS